jgi:hypothetical protein
MTDLHRHGIAIVLFIWPSMALAQTSAQPAAPASTTSTAQASTPLSQPIAQPCGNTGSGTAQPSSSGAARPDVELFATVTAKSLRFETVANGASIAVTPASPGSVCVLEHNLPTPLEPNRVYTDVVIKLLIQTDLATLTRAAAPRP